MRIKYINNKKTLNFGYCKVVKEKEDFYGIYRKDILLIHKRTWNQATKIVHLLNEAWREGHESGYKDCEHEYDMDESELY